MITRSNLKRMLETLGFYHSSKNIYEKRYESFDCFIQVDFGKEKIIYPEDKGMRINRHTTDNFKFNENFVVLECVDRLLTKGYRPEHIELEKKWSVGYRITGGEDSGFADICVYNNEGKTLFIVECKTEGKEYEKECKNMESYGGQLFSYWQQDGSCKYLVLYASKLSEGVVCYDTESVDCSDDPNILELAKKDDSIRLYKDAHTVEELYECWSETYERRFCGDVIFRDDSVAYNIGVKPLRKCDLKDFSENDKIVNKFEEILRHNNVSDKENAFNRLIALFICKLVDEMQKGDNDEVDFQYKVGSDTYESLQDRLQRLHKEGMEKFMREEIFYVPDTYAEEFVQQYSGHKRKNMIEDLKKTLRILKFYTNNDFAFKNVHNAELFYQNGKIVVEVVQLFEHFRIIGSSDVQMLGDLFEQLLNKGFKQNEGQFFTPIPIARFIWDSLPVMEIIRKTQGIEYPKIIDYACGAGHFLTQGVEAVNASVKKINPELHTDNSWVEGKVYGIEKDYRLARVSKISLFMHGAGDANIVFGDGLENYTDKGITPESFDVLVANPPYAVKAFKSHLKYLKLKDNGFRLLPRITNEGSEIETLFVERIAQLIKPNGLAAVILPSSILSNDSGSYIGAREELLQHFYIRAITCFGSKTFGATGTNTVVLFLQKINEPPVRFKLVEDSADAILSGKPLVNWEDEEIYEMYLAQTESAKEFYDALIAESKPYTYFADDEYLKNYISAFEDLAEVRNKLKQKTFQKLSDEEQANWKNQHFYSFVKECEKEKLMYFAMVYKQTVLIVTAPADNAKQKAFLGYDWSNRKGNEGIVINTPGGMLYNAANRFDENTISGLIRNSYSGVERTLKDYKEYYCYNMLRDMIDFSRVEFNKSIKTALKKKISSKYPLEMVRNLLLDINGVSTKVSNTEVKQGGSIPVISQNTDSLISGYVETDEPINDLPVVLFGDHTCCFKYIDFPFVRGADGTQLLKFNSTVICKYMYYVLQSVDIENKDKYERHNKYLKRILVPVPPRDIQQKIVEECTKIDEEYNTTHMAIENYRTKIEKIFADLEVIGGTRIRIKSVADFFTDRIASEAVSVNDYVTTDNMRGQCEGITDYEGEVPSGNVVSYHKADILLSNIRPYLKKIWFADKEGGCSADVLVLRVTGSYNPLFLYYQLKRDQYFNYVMEDVSGVKMPRGKKQHILSYLIFDLSREKQDEVVKKISGYEAEITKLNNSLAGIFQKKEDVLKRYL